jgi:energy-coupling factor transporter ATP-binding protein EcfA2
MGGVVSTVLKVATGKGGLAGLSVTFGLMLAKQVLSKPGARASLNFLLGRLFSPGEALSLTPSTVGDTAYSIVRLFREKGLKPDRIAVDGVPGSGKSTLAKALAERLGMETVCLDHKDMGQPRDFIRDNTIYEHHRLLRTQGLDTFDVVIYIDEPVDISRKKVLERKRGGYLVDVMDYDLLKRIGEKAFACAAGEPQTIENTFIKVKLRPEGGFRDREIIEKELQGKGREGTGRTKEEALFLCVENTAKQGVKAYINLHAYDRDVLTALVESLPQSGRGRRGR